MKRLGESLSQLVILARTDEGGPDPVALDVLATVDERLHAWIPATDAASGAGLGLVIASMLISSPGGSLRLEDREDGLGLRASVRLPTPAPTFDDRLLPAWSRGLPGSTGQTAD